MLSPDRYSLLPHVHYKIWLSKDPNQFLSFLNKKRLIDMRRTNPKDTITLVYDSNLLNNEAQVNLVNFCRELYIIPFDIKHKLFDFKTREYQVIEEELSHEEKLLLNMYAEECLAIKSGGNLAVCKDILIWLSAIYRLGVYTDFDVSVNTQGLPDVLHVTHPLLFNLGSYIINFIIVKTESCALNIDIVAIVDEEASQRTVEMLRRAIIAAHQPKNHSRTPPVRNSLFALLHATPKAKTPYNELAQAYVSQFQEKANLECPTILCAASPAIEVLDYYYKKGYTPLKIRQKLHALSQSLPQFVSEFCRMKGVSKDKHYVVAKFRLQYNFHPLIKILMKRQLKEKIKRFTAMSDDDFLLAMRDQWITHVLKALVMSTTGPARVQLTLFRKYLLEVTNGKSSIYAPLSFEHYGLRQHFQSENSIRLLAPFKDIIILLTESEVGKTNDASWLSEGAAKLSSIDAAMTTDHDSILSSLREITAEIDELRTNIKNRVTILENKSLLLFGKADLELAPKQLLFLKQIETCYLCPNIIFALMSLIDDLSRHDSLQSVLSSGSFATHFTCLVEKIEATAVSAMINNIDVPAEQLLEMPESPYKDAYLSVSPMGGDG